MRGLTALTASELPGACQCGSDAGGGVRLRLGGLSGLAGGETMILRMEGHVLLDALEAAPRLRPALDVSSTAPGVQVPSGETPVVDDPRWAET